MTGHFISELAATRKISKRCLLPSSHERQPAQAAYVSVRLFLRSPYWASFYPTATSTRSRRSLLSWPFDEDVRLNLCSPYWTSLEPTATSIRSRRYMRFWPSAKSVRAGPVSASSTSDQRETRGLIEGTIPLPGLALLRSKSYLAQLYAGRHFSARQMVRMTQVSRSVVLVALAELEQR